MNKRAIDNIVSYAKQTNTRAVRALALIEAGHTYDAFERKQEVEAVIASEVNRATAFAYIAATEQRAKNPIMTKRAAIESAKWSDKANQQITHILLELGS